MSGPSRPASPPLAWIACAHVIGGLVVGALDAARLRSVGIALAVVPIAAATGLVVGAFVAACEKLGAGRRGWIRALLVAAPSLIVTTRVASTLFDGAYAQTLPGAQVWPYALPVAAWLVTALAVAIGRALLRGGDLVARSIVVLALAGAIGGLVWAERHVLRTGYPAAHVGGTIAVIVLIGIAVRVSRRGSVPALAAAVVAGLVIGTATAGAWFGLARPEDRARLATFGDQSRDLVHLWRGVFDLDRDGSSPLLGGGDCDDLDAARHPGAIDVPGDHIDQDCDGRDAQPLPPPAPAAAPAGAAAAPKLDPATWRARPDVHALLERTRSMNVVVITVDALRRDLLAPGAPDRDDFPHLAKLIDDSVWFAHAIAPASGTDVSLSTLLTGRFDPFQAVATTLPEAMRASGRRTTAAIPGEVLRFVGEVLIARGIDHLATIHTDWQVRDVGDHVSAGATVAEGLRALAEAKADPGRPIFVWLHFFDVHEHHQIDVPRELLAKVHDGGSPVMHKYRALLRAIDEAVGQLLAQVDDHTIVVFASDHGESLGDDPRLLDTHGQVAYATLVRVPLAIRIPGVPPGRRDDPATLVDLAPTLLDLVGDPGAIAPLDGTDLVPILLDAPAELRPPADRAIAIHEELQWSLVAWPYQLLVRPADDVVELYDLDRDPTEHEDLSTQLPDVTSRLRSLFAAFPAVKVDRTPSGRSYREQQARPPQSRAPRAAAAATSTR